MKRNWMIAKNSYMALMRFYRAHTKATYMFTKYHANGRITTEFLAVVSGRSQSSAYATLNSLRKKKLVERDEEGVWKTKGSWDWADRVNEIMPGHLQWRNEVYNNA